MNNLLRASFLRLIKHKLFYALIIFSICLSLFMTYTFYSDYKIDGSTTGCGQIMINYSVIIGVVSAVFISLLLGTEYSDGTIRNKIIVGHKRYKIYLSNLIVVSITLLLSYLIFILVTVMVGIPLLGKITIPFSQLCQLLLAIFIALFSYTSIFTFIAMIIPNKAFSAVISLILAFLLIMAALTCLYRLEAKEYREFYTMSINGELISQEEKNPRYLEGNKRKAYQFALDINPSGQMFQLAGRANPSDYLPLYSFSLIIFITALGIVIFNKKDQK